MLYIYEQDISMYIEFTEDKFFFLVLWNRVIFLKFFNEI